MDRGAGVAKNDGAGAAERATGGRGEGTVLRVG